MKKEQNLNNAETQALNIPVVRHCCHCGKIAKWVIWYHKEDHEDFTDVCSKHLAQYLPRNLGVLVCPQ